MNGLVGTWSLLFTAFASAFGAVALAILASRHYARPLTVDARWPWFIRRFSIPAQHLAPWMSRVISASMLQRARKQLEAADLHPGLTPQEWMAMRIAHAVTLGLLVTCAMKVFRFLPGWLVPIGIASGYLASGIWLRRLAADTERRIVRDLPPYLDLLTICVEAGATLTSAARLIVEQAPPSPLRNYFDRVLREIRGGRTRAQAFSIVADGYGVESLTALASALAHAESAGMSLGVVLRIQSEQRSAERFQRAERLAMEAPVKMLGPLIFCIFPCTFVVLAVPIAHRLMEALST